jgi:hypothetical protein
MYMRLVCPEPGLAQGSVRFNNKLCEAAGIRLTRNKTGTPAGRTKQGTRKGVLRARFGLGKPNILENHFVRCSYN